MPAQKRGSDPHESQPKLRKLDEDGEALPSKIGPATNSLKTGQNREMTAAAPRTKIKRPSPAEGENKPAKSSKQSSPPKDSCKTASDPPLQKAKLLKSTSASCGEAPSQRANSKACLKRTASTESDDDLSSDGSKVDFFKERDDEDKARCIRKYSNKAKRKAEESSSDPQETSEDLSSEPVDPVQMDHNYGRFSDSTSPQSTDDASEKISSAVPSSEQGKQEISHNATEKVSTDTSESELESTKSSVKIESAAEASKRIEIKVVEGQIILDNKVSASTRGLLNTVTPVGEENEKKDQVESIRSQKDVGNETLASSEETLCSVIEEVTSSGNGEQPADEKTDLTFISENQAHLSSQSVSKENNLSIKCKATLDTPGKPDEVLLNETNSVPDQVEMSIPKIKIEENVTSESVAISETQMELKVQVSSEEEFNAADTVVNLCDDVNKALEKSEETLEESDRDDIDFQQSAACPEPLVEVQLNHGFATPDSCTDSSPECKDGHEENQTEMLSIKNMVPEDQMTPEVDLQSQENHLAHDNVAKIAAEFKEEFANIDQDMIIHCSAAPDTQIQEDAQVLNPDVTEETQSQELYESTTNLSTEFYEDHLRETLIENEETVNVECENLETQTVVASEISDPGPPVEIQKQEIQEVSESITVTSTEIHYDVTVDKCENMGSLECAVTDEGRSTIEKQTITAFELSDPEAKVKLQIPEGPVSKGVTVMPGEDLKELETANSKISEDAEGFVATAESLTGVDKQTAAMSEETCDMKQIEETYIQMNQMVSEHTTDIHDEALKVLENEDCDAQSRTEHVKAAATSEETSNVTEEIEEMQTQMVSEPTTNISNKAQKVLENITFKRSEDVEYVPDAQSQTEVNDEAKTTLDNDPNVAPIEEIQSQMISKPFTDPSDEAHKDLENANCDVSTKIENHIQVEITSEEASSVTSIEEMQIQMVSEPTTDIPDETHKDLESSTFRTSEDITSASAAKSPAEVNEEAKITLDDVSSVPPTEEIQSQVVGEPDEAHKDLENANCDVSTKIENHIRVEITPEEASSVTSIEEMQIQMVSEPTTDIPDETHKDLESSTFRTSEDITSASAAKSPAEVNEEETITLDDVSGVPPTEEIQSQVVSEPDEAHKDLEHSNCDVSTQIEDHVQVEITSEEESNVTSIEEIQTQMVSEPTTDIPEETHKDLESSTFHSSEDACVSVAAQSQTDVDEGAKVTPDKVTYFAPVEEMQTQVVGEPITDMSIELAENHREENEKTVGINEILESVTVTQSQMEVDATLTMEHSNPASSVEVEESQTEVGTQKAENSSNTVFVIGIQTQTIEEVCGQIMDDTPEEVLGNTVENSQNVNNEDKINSEYLTEQKNETQSDMQITSASDIPEAATLVDIQSGTKANEMQNTTSAQVSDIPVEEIQNQRSQDIREQVTDTQSVNAVECQNKMETSEISAETLIQKSLVTEPDVFEEKSFRIPSEKSHENENKITEECIDVAERPNEMEAQTTELSEEISQPNTPEQTEFQRGQEVSELTTDTESSAETQIQKNLEITENVQDLSEQVEERFRIPTDECEENDDKATEECVSITEQTNEMESTEALEEIYQPAMTKQAQSQRGQEVSELTTNTEVESDSISTESEQSFTSANHPKTDTHIPVTLGEIYYQKSDMELQNQGNEVCDDGKNEDEAASECENVPAITMKPSAETEIFYPAAVSEYQNHPVEESIKHTTSDIQTPLPFVHLENKDCDGQTEPEDVQGDVDVISGPIERADSGLEEDTNRQIINEVRVDRSGSNIEGGAESSEVIIFVCDQTDDINVQAPQEQIKHQSEFHDNQVVYEPISSPESNSGGEICTTIQLGETISFLDLQNTQTHHTLGGESNFLTNNDRLEAASPKLDDEEIVNGEICVPESQAAAEIEVDTISEAQLEQSNTTKDVKKVAEVSSSDDISVADGRSEDAAEKSEISECISAAEVTEQVQEDAGLQDAAVVATTPAPNEVRITDGSSDEFVILEPIPENEIHFDIVTQAAAESGLSASLCPDDVSVGDVANESTLNDSHQSEILEAEVQECETADGAKDPILTSSGDVLDQEMETNDLQDAQNSVHQPSVDIDITNSHSQHTTEDNNSAVIEDKCNLDLQQVQILQDIEIGHEIIVAEEENEEDGDVTIKNSPDQPTEDPPKQSDKNINDESKQKTIKTTKQNKTAEKTEDEKKVQEIVKPKKQEMNTQARTKARLAALAEQKAAASKRSANRQQLNLLALCQEIAEDIATDSMLLKKIEEEKQAAAAAEAAKAEASKRELPPTESQEADPVTIATPAGPEENSAFVTPAPEPSVAQPSTVDEPAETQPVADPPKRRFFISQISVPLKAHEKKKLTRYQRLRQVELQREKMSWARVKKLKSDQANQMFSDVDWQASFTGGYLMSPATPPPALSPPKTSPTSPAATSQPAQPKAEPMPETPKIEPVKSEPSKPEPIKTENSEPEPSKPQNVKTEPAETELAKTVPVKAEATKTEPPQQENRRTTRQSKAQASQAAASPGPAPKVTRSASKKTLPAVPPPMPNGLNAQKPKPVEYKPYRPRPKYSPDDFELDDDDLLLGAPTKRNPPTQPPRPRPQQNPAAQSKKIPVSSPSANQTRLKSQAAPPGQTLGQPKPAGTVQAQLKPAQSKPTVTATPPSRTTTSSKTAPSASAQLKSPEPVSASGQPKPAASAPPQLKTAGGTKPGDSVSSETKPSAAKAEDASVSQKPEHLPSQEQDESQKTADPLSSSIPSVETSKVSDDTKKCEEKPSVTTSHSAPEKNTETAKTEEKTSEKPCQDSETKPQDAATHLTDASLQKEVKKLKEADKDTSQTIIDAGQKHFGPVACSMCGMLYSAANPEDESQHLLFHNQFISAVKYVGWKKERILAEYPDGKIILVLPDDPKYALKKVEEIREMVDNDLGFQQVETKCPSQTKTFLFISIDKKVAGCLIAEHIQEGYRVIEEPVPEGSEGEKVMFERQRAWCCSTTPEPAVCGISRIWVVSMMRRQGIATRMLECLRNNFIYGSYLGKDEIAFSDPTPDGKLFAMHYFGTSQFLVYNFVSGPRSFQPKTHTV